MIFFLLFNYLGFLFQYQQSLVPYPSYMNRGNGRGAPGRGRQRVDVNRMRTLLNQRVPVKDIANEMGVSRLCVYYWYMRNEHFHSSKCLGSRLH